MKIKANYETAECTQTEWTELQSQESMQITGGNGGNGVVQGPDGSGCTPPHHPWPPYWPPYQIQNLEPTY